MALPSHCECSCAYLALEWCGHIPLSCAAYTQDTQRGLAFVHWEVTEAFPWAFRVLHARAGGICIPVWTMYHVRLKLSLNSIEQNFVDMWVRNFSTDYLINVVCNASLVLLFFHYDENVYVWQPQALIYNIPCIAAYLSKIRSTIRFFRSSSSFKFKHPAHKVWSVG